VELTGNSVGVTVPLSCPNVLCSFECGNAPLLVGAIPVLGSAVEPLPAPMGITHSGDSLWVTFAIDPMSPGDPGVLIRIPVGEIPIILSVPGLGRAEGVAPDGDGGVWIADAGNSGLVHRSGDGMNTAVASGLLPSPRGLVVDPDGMPTVAVADGIVAIVADLPETRIGVTGATGLGLALSGRELIAAVPPVIQRYDISTMTGVPIGEQLMGAPGARGVAVDVCDNIYVAEPTIPTIIRFPADDPTAGTGITGNIADPAYLTFAIGPGYEPDLLFVSSPAEGIIYVMDVQIPGVRP
jgi:hypothetical protein